MDVLDAIFTRRSIRKFTGEPINEDDLRTILKAGFQAPSAHGFQPRDFVVVRDKGTIEKIAQFHKYGKMLPKAGCAIIVCGDKKKQPEKGFLIEDCSASIQNILLAAHGLGLGAVWCGLYSVTDLTEHMSKILGLPENIIPIGMAVLGVKDGEEEPIDRYDESKVHFDKW